MPVYSQRYVLKELFSGRNLDSFQEYCCDQASLLGASAINVTQFLKNAHNSTCLVSTAATFPYCLHACECKGGSSGVDLEFGSDYCINIQRALHYHHIAPYRVTDPQSQLILKEVLEDGDARRGLRFGSPQAV